MFRTCALQIICIPLLILILNRDLPAQGCPTPVFSASVQYGAGANPYSVATSDFNADGKLDLAVANYNSNNVSILLGNGNGTFSVGSNFSVGNGPVSAVVAGDLNGDGNFDLVVANWYSNDISVLLGNGAGGFGSPTNFTVGSAPRALTAADLNGDGKVDIVVANHLSNNISVLLGDGTGGFSSNLTYGVGNHPCSIADGDFNADGKLDLVVANADSYNFSLLLGTGTGSFGNATSIALGGGKPYSIEKSDFNADGKLDVVAAMWTDNTVRVLLGDGTGGFGSPVAYPVGSSPSFVITGDFNNDGKADVATTNSGSNNCSVLLGNGAGALGTQTNFNVGGEPDFICKGDFNGDGSLDLATANHMTNNVSVLLNSCQANNPPIVLCKNVSVSTGTGCSATASVDNGSYDIDQGDVIVLSQNPPGPYAKGTTAVVLTATDNHGASSSCTALVTVVDDVPPIINCSANMFVSTDPGLCVKANVTYSANATDNCPGVTLFCAPPSGSTFPKGITAVACLAVDAGGNSSSCSFTIHVNDAEPPVLTPPGAITKSTDPNVCGASVTFAPTLTDNCPGAVYTCAPSSGSLFPLGTTTVLCNALDAAGNTASCSFQVTVVDQQPPMLSCPGDVTANTEPNSCSAVVIYALTAVDNCTGATYSCVPPSGGSFPKGTTTVNCTAVDGAGNTAACNFLVQVVDAQPPSITVSANPTYLWPANKKMVDVTATVNAADNCSGVTWVLESITDNEGSDPLDVEGAAYGTPDLTFKLRAVRIGSGPRIYTIVYKATDGAGNMKTATATVTVPLKKPKQSPQFEEPATPATVVLYQNYPNPFNPTTKIRFSLPEAMHATVKLYDVFMRHIATLVDEVRPAGLNEVLFDGTNVGSGTIICLLTVADGTSMIKMNLLK